jgi:mRNA interferase MazF
LPGDYGDMLICMISSRLRHEVLGFDEVISPDQEDFVRSGLKVASLVRLGRLAVVEPSMLVGSIGRIDEKRVLALRIRFARWLEAMSDER